MQDMILKLYVHAQAFKNIFKNEEGQDLIEYALVVSLIAFAAIVGMKGLATGINGAFSNLAATLNNP
ncbi:MAG: Flp family type IVb pilin [Acidobacteriota bacterium]|nr:Flp family type IVb pilin [Acidobacteriota bacterium]